jgi:hypothetical protein
MATKIDVTQKLVNFEDEPVVRIPGERCPRCGRSDPEELWDVRAALETALLQTQAKKAQDKYQNYAMARRIHERDVIELTAREVADLQEKLEILPTIIAGQVWEALEGKEDDNVSND